MQTINKFLLPVFFNLLAFSCSQKMKENDNLENNNQIAYSKQAVYDTLRKKGVEVLKIKNILLEKELVNFINSVSKNELIKKKHKSIILDFQAIEIKENSYFMQISYRQPNSFDKLLGVFEINDFNCYVYTNVLDNCFFNTSYKDTNEYIMLKTNFPKPEEFPSVDMNFKLKLCKVINLKKVYNNL